MMRQHISREAATWLAAVLAVSAAIPSAVAGEGGSSHYMAGTQGDFVMALIGPKGFYVRNDLLYLSGDIGSVTLGNRVYASASQRVWTDMIKAIYLSDVGILGGRFAAVLTVPVVFNAKVSGNLVAPPVGERSGSRSGIADVTATGFLNWNHGMSHFSSGVNVYIPVGGYNPDDIINRGRNYWSFVPTFSYTWLHPKRGHEFSGTTGVFLNTTNNATHYKTGNEWYGDFVAAQHLSPKFAIGLEGYTLQQFTDDSGPLLDRANLVLPALGLQPLGGFRGHGFGLGPAILFSHKFGGTDVNFIGKYIVDIVHTNRFNNSYAMLSVAFKL